MRICSSGRSSASTRRTRPCRASRSSWTRFSGRTRLRVPPRSRSDLGERLSRDLRRRRLHDRARPRSEGQRAQLALGLRRPRVDRDARSARRSASASRSRMPSGFSPSACRSFPRGLRPGGSCRPTRTASRTAAVPIASNPGSPTRRSPSSDGPTSRRNDAAFPRIVFRVLPDDPSVPGRSARRARRVPDSARPASRRRVLAGVLGEEPDPEGARSSWWSCFSGTAGARS